MIAAYDWTAKPVEIYSADDYTFRPSQREYHEVTVQMIHREARDYAPDEVSVANQTVYLDPETGLMVHDVAAYEKWMAR